MGITVESIKQLAKAKSESKNRLLESISWRYSNESYTVTMDNENLFTTDDKYKRDMFIAELKAKIRLA